MSQWIWKFGEFEIYHYLMVHSKRQAYGYKEPPVWKIYTPSPIVNFRKKFTTKGGRISIHACGNFSAAFIDEEGERNPQFYGKNELDIEPGTYILDIRVFNTDTFPALYVDGVIETDDSWMADDMSYEFAPVGTETVFNTPEKKPDVFPFYYQKIDYIKKEKLTDGGVLFDFGRETFARVHLTGLTDDQTFRIQYGESREEALDSVWSVTHFDTEPFNGTKDFEPYAFRYIYISDDHAEVEAEYEYLSFKQQGSFRCNDEQVNKIWDVAAYTFQLNCREFFLDGIKRDRWVWAADVYQSLFVNRYLFLDKEIEQRTLIALGGKAPFKRHINTIVDYTFFWFMSLYEHYKTYGDIAFLEKIKPQMDEIMKFCFSRTDADGLIRGKEGDWVFIDWAKMDKTGALCGEQILYAKAMESYSKICMLLKADDMGCAKKADVLQKIVLTKFWDAQQKAFIDSFESGRRNITRQSNILAYLFLPCSAEQKRSIYENVILNEKITPITTPYFKFYENQVHCLAGNADILENFICGYYGSMLETGATSLYEQYDPKNKGVEHYAMYGRPYEKSLCHAWSASPIYLLGNFRLGVQNTGIAYDSFEVRPQLGKLESVVGKVPVPGGYVKVSMDRREICVLSDIPGGILYFEGKKYLLDAKKECRIQINSDARKK